MIALKKQADTNRWKVHISNGRYMLTKTTPQLIHITFPKLYTSYYQFRYAKDMYSSMNEALMVSKTLLLSAFNHPQTYDPRLRSTISLSQICQRILALLNDASPQKSVCTGTACPCATMVKLRAIRQKSLLYSRHHVYGRSHAKLCVHVRYWFTSRRLSVYGVLHENTLV